MDRLSQPIAMIACGNMIALCGASGINHVQLSSSKDLPA
jgi:hypothetical protein